MKNVAFGGGHALNQTVKQHLYQLNTVGLGHAGTDLDLPVRLDGTVIGSHDFCSCDSMFDNE
jgi:hypothetical protein